MALDNEWKLVEEVPLAEADGWALVEEFPIEGEPQLSDPGPRGRPGRVSSPSPHTVPIAAMPMIPGHFSTLVGAAQEMANAPPPPSWGEVLAQAPTQAAASSAQTIAGVRARDDAKALFLASRPPYGTPEWDEWVRQLEMAGEGGRSDLIRRMHQLNTDPTARAQAVEDIRQQLAIASEAETDLNAAALPNRTLLQRGVGGAATSLPQAGTALALGMATGSPYVAAGSMFPLTAGQEFPRVLSEIRGQQNAQNLMTGRAPLTPEEIEAQRASAIGRSLFHTELLGTSAAGTEFLPFSKLLKPGASFLSRLLGDIVFDIPGEAVDTLVGSIDEEIIKKPQGAATMDDVLVGLQNGIAQLPETVVTTLLMGGAQAGVASAPQAIENAIRSQREQAMLDEASARKERPLEAEMARRDKERAEKRAQQEREAREFTLKEVTPEDLDEITRRAEAAKPTPPDPFVPDPNVQPPLSAAFGKIPEPPISGSPAPEPGGAQAPTAPTASPTQGTATPPLSSALGTPQPAAPPSAPAPTEPAPAPAPAAPAVSTTQEPVGGATAPAEPKVQILTKGTGLFKKGTILVGGVQVTPKRGQSIKAAIEAEIKRQKAAAATAAPAKPAQQPQSLAQVVAPQPGQQQQPPRSAGLVGEQTKEARESLDALLGDPTAHVRKYEPTKTGGWTTTDPGPAWTEMGNGFAARQYINEYAGTRMPVQEIRSPNGGIAQRGIDTQGNPYGTLDVKGIGEFERFFKRGKAQQQAAAPAATPALPAPLPPGSPGSPMSAEPPLEPAQATPSEAADPTEENRIVSMAQRTLDLIKKTLGLKYDPRVEVLTPQEMRQRPINAPKWAQGLGVAGHVGGVINLVKGRISADAVLEEVRHMIDMIMGGYGTSNRLKSDPQLTKRVKDFLKGRPDLAPHTRYDDEREIAQSLIDQFFRNPEAVRAALPEMYQWFDEGYFVEFVPMLKELYEAADAEKAAKTSTQAAATPPTGGTQAPAEPTPAKAKKKAAPKAKAPLTQELPPPPAPRMKGARPRRQLAENVEKDTKKIAELRERYTELTASARESENFREPNFGLDKVRQAKTYKDYADALAKHRDQLHTAVAEYGDPINVPPGPGTPKQIAATHKKVADKIAAIETKWQELQKLFPQWAAARPIPEEQARFAIRHDIIDIAGASDEKKYIKRVERLGKRINDALAEARTHIAQAGGAPAPKKRGKKAAAPTKPLSHAAQQIEDILAQDVGRGETAGLRLRNALSDEERALSASDENPQDIVEEYWESTHDQLGPLAQKYTDDVTIGGVVAKPEAFPETTYHIDSTELPAAAWMRWATRMLRDPSELPAREELDEETIYPQVATGPVRINLGSTKPAGKSEKGVTELTTTPDKFEEIIDVVPALFAAPTRTVYPSKEPGYGPLLSQEEAAKRIESWLDHAKAQKKISHYKDGNSNRVIYSLFDWTGEWAKPWKMAGYDVRYFDIKDGADVRRMASVQWWIDHLPDITDVYGFLIATPCTDFTISGSQWWRRKDADGRTEASKELVSAALSIVEYFKPQGFWSLENPFGSRIKGLMGLPRPALTFQPHDFGDPYTKNTSLWGNFVPHLPTAPVKPVEGSKMHAKLGGRSERTKELRSETPEGFAAAFFMANNYLDVSPQRRLTGEYPMAAGAIEEALAAGIPEKEIVEAIGSREDVHDDEGDAARATLRKMVKERTGTAPATTKAKKAKKPAKPKRLTIPKPPEMRQKGTKPPKTQVARADAARAEVEALMPAYQAAKANWPSDGIPNSIDHDHQNINFILGDLRRISEYGSYDDYAGKLEHLARQVQSYIDATNKLLAKFEEARKPASLNFPPTPDAVKELPDAAQEYAQQKIDEIQDLWTRYKEILPQLQEKEPYWAEQIPMRIDDHLREMDRSDQFAVPWYGYRLTDIRSELAHALELVGEEVTPSREDADGYRDWDKVVEEGAISGQDEDIGEAAAREGGRLDDAPLEDRRRPRPPPSKKRPSPLTQTREGEIGASPHNQIWTENDLKPTKMNLLLPPERYAEAVRLVKKKFAFRSITKDPLLSFGEAVDILKDAFVGLTNHAAVLNMNPGEVSLNGRLALALYRDAPRSRYPGPRAFYAPSDMTIGMVRRNDSFTHEWAHAVDHWMLELFAKELMALPKGQLLTGKIRSGGTPVTMHAQLREAFVDVLNAMFFDQAEAALYIMDLQSRILAAKTPSAKTQLQKQLDNYLQGHARARNIESEYYKRAKAMEGGESEDGGYLQMPTEMLARAVEAYMARKLAGYPADHPFATKTVRMYDENRVAESESVFPQGMDRGNIDAAIDNWMRALRDLGLVGSGSAPAVLDPTATEYWKKQVPYLGEQEARTAKQIAAKIYQDGKVAAAEMDRANVAGIRRKEHDAKTRAIRLGTAKPEGLRKMSQNIALTMTDMGNGIASGLWHSIRGVLLSQDAKYPGNPGLPLLIQWFATDPGAGTRVQGPIYMDEVRHKERKYQNRLGSILEGHRVHRFTTEERMDLRDVLVNSIPSEAVAPHVAAAAEDLRHLLNDMWNYNQDGGVNIGYAKNGFLPRVVDLMAVEDDVDGFRTAARGLYSIVFDKEIGTLEEVLADREKLIYLLYQTLDIANNGRLQENKDAAKRLEPLAESIRDTLKAMEEAEDGKPAEDEQFAEMVENLWTAMRPIWASEAANDWELRIRGIGAQPEWEFDQRSVASKYTKSRVLPPETDTIMRDFLKNDAVELITTYISQSVRRVEYGRMFGNPEGGKELGWKLDAALTAMKDPYRARIGDEVVTHRVDPEDADEIRQSINLLLGNYNTSITRRGLRFMNSLMAFWTPVVLAKSLKSQIAEPWTASIKMGFKAGFAVYGKQFEDLIAWGGDKAQQMVDEQLAQSSVLQFLLAQSPGFKELHDELRALLGKLGIQGIKRRAMFRRELGEFFGYVTHHLTDNVMATRYNVLNANTADKLKLARFFYALGIHPHAMSMRRGIGEYALMRYLPSLARKALRVVPDTGGGTGAAVSRQARKDLADMGIDATNTALLLELVRLPELTSMQEMQSLRFLAEIRTAVNRATNQTSQEPGPIDKPIRASLPETAIFYAITGFQSAFTRNILIGSAKRAARSLRDDVTVGIGTNINMATGFALLMGTTLAAWIAGVMAFDDDDWEEKVKKIKEQWLGQMLTRTGLFGATDMVVNAFMGFKYQKDLATTMAGPIAGQPLSLGQAAGNLIARNSPSTAAAEYAAIEQAFQKLVMPQVMAKILRYVGHNPYIDTAFGIGAPFMNSPWVSNYVSESFTEFWTGQEYLTKNEIARSKKNDPAAKAAVDRAEAQAKKSLDQIVEERLEKMKQ